MAAFVLANKRTDELETTVFSGEGGDTVAVFSDAVNAQQYLKDAGWEDEMTVAELHSIQLIEWLLHCYRNGVRLMATDPRRSEQEAGLRVNTLDIEGQLEYAGDHIIRVANPEL